MTHQARRELTQFADFMRRLEVRELEDALRTVRAVIVRRRLQHRRVGTLQRCAAELVRLLKQHGIDHETTEENPEERPMATPTNFETEIDWQKRHVTIKEQAGLALPRTFVMPIAIVKSLAGAISMGEGQAELQQLRPVLPVPE